MGAIMAAIAELTIKSELTPTTSIPSEIIWRLSVSQYHAMIQTGIIDEDAQIELLEGFLISKMPKNPPHRLSTGLLQDALLAIIPANYHLNLQEPITLVDGEPESDLVIVRGKRLDYRDRHPTGADVVLVIEVSDASLERDRTIKQRIYARAGIPIYWILNLRDRQLEIYTEPININDNPQYQQCQVFTETAAAPVCWADETGDREFGNICLQDLL
jgi:Uma2 family endonuclease